MVIPWRQNGSSVNPRSTVIAPQPIHHRIGEDPGSEHPGTQNGPEMGSRSGVNTLNWSYFQSFPVRGFDHLEHLGDMVLACIP